MEPIAVTRCTVRVVTPDGGSLLFGPGPRSADDIAAGRPLEGGLLAVEVEKDMTRAVGSFTLTLDGRPDSAGRHWDERIPMRSLVFITMTRLGTPSMPDVEPTVMIGLTDSHQHSESYEGAGPRRLVVVRGRELSCVILDCTLVFNPLLSAQATLGLLTMSSSVYDTITLALSVDPMIGKAQNPITLLQFILNRYLFVGGPSVQTDAGARPPIGTGTPPPPTPPGTPASNTSGPQQPLITLDIPNMPLSRLLDPNYDAWSTFEKDLIVTNVNQSPQNVGNLWTYLHIFIDRHFQEFFTRIEEGQCKLYFRGKPFRHEHIEAGSRFKGSDGPASVENEPTLQTLALDPADILGQQVGRDSTQVYNFFLVIPRGMADLKNAINYTALVMPQIIVNHEHPSFVGRYGIRMMKDETQYLSPFAESNGTATPITSVQPVPPQPAGAAPWADKANTYATLAGVIPAHRPWFVALIQQESGFDPTARHKNPNGSEDQGMAQFNSSYNWSSVGLTDPFNPENALPAAARYWQQLRAQVGDDPRLIAAAYNAGPQAVLDAKGIPPQAAQHVRDVTSYVPRHQHYAGTAPPKHGVEVPTPPEGRPGRPEAPPVPPAAAATRAKGDADIIAKAQRWGALLMAWHDMGGELFSGSLTVRGHPSWNIGHRLTCRDARGDWEAYIEGVRHSFNMRTGQYLTTMRITRGWYLARTMAAQIWREALTTVTESTGGPPVLHPVTGEVDQPIKSVTIIELEDFYRRFPAERPPRGAP